MPSQTAVAVTLIRAASFLEKNPHLKSDDYLAHIFLLPPIQFLIKFPFIRAYIRKHLPDRTFDSVVERTKFIDSIIAKNCDAKIDQIVVMGAGFDSRGLRFIAHDSHTRVFEVDQNTTQKIKQSILDKNHVDHSHITYIPLDLNVTLINDSLLAAGFLPNKKTIFIMEGVLMYLQPTAVDTLLNCIHRLGGSQSTIIFDYMFDINHSKSAKIVTDLHEPYRFKLPKKEIKSFMSKRSFRLKQQVGAINGNQAFVQADIMDL